MAGQSRWRRGRSGEGSGVAVFSEPGGPGRTRGHMGWSYSKARKQRVHPGLPGRRFPNINSTGGGARSPGPWTAPSVSLLCSHHWVVCGAETAVFMTVSLPSYAVLTRNFPRLQFLSHPGSCTDQSRTFGRLLTFLKRKPARLARLSVSPSRSPPRDESCPCWAPSSCFCF